MSHPRLRRLKLAATTAGLFVLIAAAATDAHVLKDFGPYSVALGWVTEPTYVGQVNAVQVVVKDKQGKADHRRPRRRPQGRCQRRRADVGRAVAHQQVRRGHRPWCAR